MIRCALLSYFTTPIFAPFSVSFSSFRTINRNKSCGYSENFWCVEKLAAALQCFKLYMCYMFDVFKRKVRRWDESMWKRQRQRQRQPTNFVCSCIFRFHFNCSHSTQTSNSGEISRISSQKKQQSQHHLIFMENISNGNSEVQWILFGSHFKFDAFPTSKAK